MNGSAEEPGSPLPTFSAAAKVRVAVTCLLFLSSSCCNGAVLCAVVRAKRRPPRVRVLMAHLAAADLLVTVVVMPLDAAWNVTVQWYGGEAACRALMFLKLAAMYASAFVTVVIALDRHDAIVCPLGARGAARRSRAMLGAAWGMSAVLALPQAFVFHTVSRSRPRRFVQCATVGSFAARWQETLYNMFTFACLFLLPLLVMLLCYGRILAAISGTMRAARAPSQDVQLRRSHDRIPRARMRTLKMSVVVVLTFVGCWTPYYLLGLWYWFSPEMLSRGRVPPALSHILFLFGLFNTCLDPLVYGFFTVHFCGRRRHRDATSGSVRASIARRTPSSSTKHELGVMEGGKPAGQSPKRLRDSARGGVRIGGGAQLGFNEDQTTRERGD
ncbi:gonadotropin-releasing hormone II receptor-like [Phasianus colchicus]|uniref:Type II GnRH receptor n=1 Tax=Phasianus colchicus TaxID=9054 RepID=A0A669QJE0_PHACC|nr:gonadotropin-releasing hormone II receptor-like [Phasianus colchicus]